MNTKQQVVATVLAALIATSAARADEIEYSMPQSVTTTASAQTVAATSWKDVMSGSSVPLTIKGRDLNASWRSFTVSENNDLRAMMLGAYGLTGSNALYSRGDEISVAGETYLVTYRLKTSPVDLVRMNTSNAEMMMRDMVLKPDSTLQLSLLNVRMTGAFNQVQTFDPAVFNASSTLNSTFTRANQAAQQASSNSNLKQLMLGVMQYAMDYDDEKFPPMESMYVLKKAVLPYVKNEAIFRQPDNKKFYVPNAALSRKSLSRLQFPSAIAAIYEADFGSDGKRSVAFADGHVKRITPDEWTQIKQDSDIK